MKILWLMKLPLTLNIIHLIAGNEANKCPKTLKVSADENEPNYETETDRTTERGGREIPEYPNTFAIPGNDESSKVPNDEWAEPPSIPEKNENVTTQNRCGQCDVSFRYDRHYAKHCEGVHGIKRPFPCGYCDRAFKYRQNLVHHVNEAHDVKRNPYARWKKNEPITCDVCRETISGWMKFEEHALSRHEGMKTISCSHCPEKFFRRRQMLRHEKVQHGNFVIKCEICKNIFGRSDLLKEHSEFCEQKQIQNKMGDNQLDTIIRYGTLVCEECGDEHKTMALLRDHHRLKHPRLKLHPCDHCDAAFRSAKTLEKHACMLHPDKARHMKNWRKFKKGAIYACEHCKGNFAGKSEYEKHGKRQHPGLPLFRCKDCGRGYSTRKTLSNHANEAHGDAKRRCLHCSRCYYQIWTHEKRCEKKSEKREGKRLAGYPKHYCGLCSQNFYMTDPAFGNHVSQHKYYESCSECGQRFLRGKGGLNKHVERKHPLRGNIEALLRTADHVRTMVKKESKRTEDFFEVDGSGSGSVKKFALN